MATQAERIEALETENKALTDRLTGLDKVFSTLALKVDDLEGIIKDGEALDELRDLVAKAAPLKDFETLSEKVETLAGGALMRSDIEAMEPITAELVEGYDPRDELLKAFRQIEAIANHINVKLPS